MAFSYRPDRMSEMYPWALMPAGQAKLHGLLPKRSMLAFLGTACENGM